MRTRSRRTVGAAAWVHRRAAVRARAHVFVSLWVCLRCACFVCSSVLHASFARRRDAVESSLSARPAVLGALSGPVPCRDPAVQEPVRVESERQHAVPPPPSFHTRAHLHAHARACAHARARQTYWLGSARPAVAAQAAVVDGAACARLDDASSTRCGRVCCLGHTAGTCRSRRASASAIATSAQRRSA
jgi:hypothetical protein